MGDATNLELREVSLQLFKITIDNGQDEVAIEFSSQLDQSRFQVLAGRAPVGVEVDHHTRLGV